MQRYSLGIDICGTFTDIVVYDTKTGGQSSHKELTTHDDPSRAVMSAIDRVIREGGIPPSGISRVVHATTLFTNALIERKNSSKHTSRVSPAMRAATFASGSDSLRCLLKNS